MRDLFPLSAFDGRSPDSGQDWMQALMDVQLDTGVPMISAVLTPHHFHEHAEHRKYFMRHIAVKGSEAAEACLLTVAGLRKLDAMLSA